MNTMIDKPITPKEVFEQQRRNYYLLSKDCTIRNENWEDKFIRNQTTIKMKIQPIYTSSNRVHMY